MDITIEDVTACLRPLRRNGIVAVAIEIGVSPSALMKIAYGYTTSPRYDTMQKLLPWVRAQLEAQAAQEAREAPRRRQRRAA